MSQHQHERSARQASAVSTRVQQSAVGFCERTRVSAREDIHQHPPSVLDVSAREVSAASAGGQPPALGKRRAGQSTRWLISMIKHHLIQIG